LRYTEAVVDPASLLYDITGFDWDEGNLEKNWVTHEVRWTESEEVFSRRPLLIVKDERHSRGESRYAAWGRTANERRLFIVFTVRGSLIRVVAARDMNRGERRAYDDAEKVEADPKVQE
jgi:uncharacterized protein